jgi:exosortase
MTAEPTARPIDAQPGLAHPASVGPVPLVIAVVFVASLLMWPTATSLHAEWTNTQDLTFLHGYLIAALSAWLLARALSSADAPAAPDWRALPLLAALSLCWLIAQRAGIEIVHQGLWPIILLTTVCAMIGFRAGLRCWFAFAFLYFAIPVWSAGDQPLQMLTVAAVKVMLQISAIPAFVEGTIVHIPEGAFAIEPSCNGMHFFIVATAIAALFGEIHHDLFKVRLRQMLLAAAFALMSNWIRVYVVVVAGHLTEMQHYLIRVSHYYFGWAVFAVCMAVYFWLVSRTPARTLPAAAPLRFPAGARRVMIAGVLWALFAVGIGPVLGALAPVAGPSTPHSLLPPVSGWLGPVSRPTSWQPVYPGSDRAELAEYQRDGMIVSSYIAEYDEQRQGKELVGYGNSLLNGLPGTVTRQETLPLERGTAVQLRLDGPGDMHSVVGFYYDIGGAHRVSGLGSQLTYAMKSLFRSTTSRVIAVRVECTTDCTTAMDAARQWLDGFARTQEHE